MDACGMQAIMAGDGDKSLWVPKSTTEVAYSER